MIFKKNNASSKFKTRLKRNDVVVVNAGKEKGKTGTILRIDLVRGRVFVQSLNMVKKAMRPSEQNEKGGIIEKEGSIHISNLMLWDEKSSTSGRAGTKEKNGKKVRVIRKRGKEIEI
ncbi:50S ribosomal protein L24 [PVC group bacterium]|nr:50S ribosomal protein L24 [PVC group bacterium]